MQPEQRAISLYHSHHGRVFSDKALARGGRRKRRTRIRADKADHAGLLMNSDPRTLTFECGDPVGRERRVLPTVAAAPTTDKRNRNNDRKQNIPQTAQCPSFL